MKNLAEYKENIHSCSKCGLCQAVCPIYKITGNDCSVSRGQFIMLRGLLKGDLKMSAKLNRYLDLCLKCGACSKFCPSGIDVVDIIVSAKAEYFKKHPFEKVISFIQKYFIFGFGVKCLGIFAKNIKSKKFEKKVLYFGGCSGKIKGNRSVVKLLNACNIEVITPNFNCCGMPFLTTGNLDRFEEQAIENIEKLPQDFDYFITDCASCESTILDYSKYFENLAQIQESKSINWGDLIAAKGIKFRLNLIPFIYSDIIICVIIDFPNILNFATLLSILRLTFTSFSDLFKSTTTIDLSGFS